MAAAGRSAPRDGAPPAAQHPACASPRGAPPQLLERACALADEESSYRDRIAEEAGQDLDFGLRHSTDYYYNFFYRNYPWCKWLPEATEAVHRAALKAKERAARRDDPRGLLLLMIQQVQWALDREYKEHLRPFQLLHAEAVLRDAVCQEEQERRAELPLRGDLRLIGARERERGAVRAAEAAARCALLAAAERSSGSQHALVAELAARAELLAAEEGARAAAELRATETALWWGAAGLRALARAEAAARERLVAAARWGLRGEELRVGEWAARAAVEALEAAERALGGAAVALVTGEARRRGWGEQEEAYERRALRLLRISGTSRRLGPGAGELQMRAALEQREREQLSVEVLAAVPQSAVGVAALRGWLTGLAAEGGLGPGSGARGLGEALCFARLAAAETVEERDAAMAELGELLRRDPPELAALCGGGAAAAVHELPPDEEALSPQLAAGAALAERALTAAEAEGFAAKQQQGALEPPPAAAAEPEAVRRRREGLRPAFSERTRAEWRLAPAPAGRSMAEAAGALAAALRRAAGCIEAGTPAAAGSRAIGFILELPRRLAAALPGASLWFTDQHVLGAEVWRERPCCAWHRRGRWVRRATGLLGVLRDVLTRAAEQVQWADENGLWDCPDRLGQLVGALKEGEGLSAGRLALLVADAARDLRSLDALLRAWDTSAALELFVAGFLYCANLPQERFGLVPGSGAGGKAEPKDPPDGKKNHECQIFHAWNRALRESTDSEWALPVSDADKAAHRRVVELFEPIAYLLTELVRSTAATGDAPTVSRGVNVRVSDQYVMGTAVPLAQFTSTSTDDRASLKFAGAAGTWFKMQVINAASVSFCSPFPNERELLLPHGTITEVGFKFGGTLLMLLESQRDLVVVSEWSDNPRPTEETVEQRCRTLKDNTMLFEDFRERFVEPLCDVYEGDGKTPLKEGVRLFRVFEDFLESDQVHVMVLLGGGGIGKSSSLVALMHQASVAADWVPVFDGLHQIEGLLSSPGSPAKRGCYLEHLKRCVLQCRDASEALRLFLQRKVFHALDSLDEASGALPEGLPLLRSMGLDAGTSSKVAISTRPEHLQHRGISMRRLYGGALWRVELRGFDQSDIGRFAELTTLAWARCEEQKMGAAGYPGQLPDVPAAAERAAEALRGLRAADEPLSRIPFAAKMAADMALAERVVDFDGQGSLKWRLVSEWGVLQVEQQAPRFPKLRRYDRDVLQAMAARVALAINSLLILTAEWQGVLAPFAAVLRCPSLLVEPDADSRAGGLQFNPPLSPEERVELADYLGALLSGIPPRRVRELLGVLPFRCEHLDSDRGMFSFRHKIVAEWMGALWFVASLRHSAPESVPSVLLRRFVHPHCIDSYQLVLVQTECDPSLTFSVRHRAAQQPQQQQRIATGTSSEGGEDPSAQVDMPARLRMLARAKRHEDPLPPLVSADWVRGTFAAAVMRHYDPIRRGVLTRRQMGTLWHAGVRGNVDAPLLDDEWCAEQSIDGQGGRHPSVLQAVRLGGGEVGTGAVELTEEQLGAWMWGLLKWCTCPVQVHHHKSYNSDDKTDSESYDRVEPSYRLGGWLARGLLRLWEMADAATAHWTVQRAAAQLVEKGAAGRCVRKLSERCLEPSHRSAEELLWLARLLAQSRDTEGWVHLLNGFFCKRLQQPQRRCYAAKPAAAFRAALCSCTATIEPAALAGREYVGRSEEQPPEFFVARPGQRGDWGEVGLQLGGAAELLRREWVASLCAELRKGGKQLSLAGIYPGAWQLELLRRAAQSAAVLRHLWAVDCDRFGELPVAAALLRLVAECASVRSVSLDGSPVPEAVQQRLAAVLELRLAADPCPWDLRGLTHSALQAALLPAPLEERSPSAMSAYFSSDSGCNYSGEQLAASCAAARRNPLSVRAEVDARMASLTEWDWEPLAALVCDMPSIARIDFNTRPHYGSGLPRPSSAPLWVRNIICAAICGRMGFFQDYHGRQGAYYDPATRSSSRTFSERQQRLAQWDSL